MSSFSGLVSSELLPSGGCRETVSGKFWKHRERGHLPPPPPDVLADDMSHGSECVTCTSLDTSGRHWVFWTCLNTCGYFWKCLGVSGSVGGGVLQAALLLSVHPTPYTALLGCLPTEPVMKTPGLGHSFVVELWSSTGKALGSVSSTAKSFPETARERLFCLYNALQSFLLGPTWQPTPLPWAVCPTSL